MNKLVFLILTISLIRINCYAQEITYRGEVTSKDGVPLEWVNVVALTLPDSTAISGAITDEDGRFVLTINTPHDNIIVRVSLLGYESLYLSPQSLESITLTDTSAELSELVVTAQRKPFSIENNKVVCNISGTSLISESSIDGLLSKLPGFYIQGDQLKSFSKGSIVFYINDRPASNEAVYQLDIKSIKKVEIDRHPGARFSGEVGTVVYFYTHKPLEGISSFIRSFSRFNHRYTQGVDAELRYQFNNFVLTLGADYTLYQSKTNQDNTFEMVDPSVIWKVTSNDTKERNKETSQSYFIDFNYTPSEKHLLSLRYNYKPSKDDALFKGSLSVEDNGHLLNEVFENQYNGNSTRHNINFYYKYKPNEVWTIDVASDWFDQDKDSSFDLREETRLINTHSTSNSSLIGLSPRAIYQAKQYRIEFGGDWSNSAVESTTFLNIKDANPTDNKIEETKLAGYVDIGYQINEQWDLNMGLRYETTNKKFLDRKANAPTQHFDYQSFLPSLSVAYSTGDWRYQLSYYTSINYPSFSQLSSGDSYINRYNISKSNADLERSVSHDISADVSYRWLYLSAAYTYTYRPIFDTFHLEEIGDSRRVVVSPKNLDQMHALALIANIAPTFDFYEPRVTLGYIQNSMTLPATDKEHSRHISSPFMIFSFNNSFNLPKGWVLGLDYSYTGAGNYGYIKYTSSSSLNASILKYFFDQRLQISLKAIDILDNSTQRKSGSYEGVSMNSYAWMDRRSIRLNIIWRFNQHRSPKKHSSISTEINRL